MTPFLRWPGGKRWFVAGHPELLPAEFGTYWEPFLGGGAVFFHLRPREAVLADAIPELIATYGTIQLDGEAVARRLQRHQAGHDTCHYYRTRGARRTGDPLTEAARFIYLNRTCFNGIYRVNRDGDLDLPIGREGFSAIRHR